jgi:hypothetical protein
MTITALRAQEGKRITGDASFDGTPTAYANATADQRIQITNAMKAYIRANPSEFDASQVQVANTADITLSENYTAGQMVSDFTEEMGNQAVELNNAVNPFSEANRKWILWAAVLIAAAYLILPQLMRARAESKVSPPAPAK